VNDGNSLFRCMSRSTSEGINREMVPFGLLGEGNESAQERDDIRDIR
jgi:hypothetical protein